MQTQEIIKENERRKKILFEHYDPVTGEGSPIERFKLYIDKEKFINVPVSMKEEPFIKLFKDTTLTDFLAERNSIHLFSDAMNDLTKLRLKHDFEFWAYTTIHITDKIQKKMVRFKLNRPQRIILAELESARLSNLPVRKLLGKARQFGGSTLILFWFLWIQLLHKVNWHSAIVSLVEEQARHIRSMITRSAFLYPKNIGTITLKPHEGSYKNRMIRERGNIVGIGSTEKPDNLRTFDFSMLHLSEVGLWATTKGKSPEDLTQSLKATVPKVPYSVIIKESTAKGVGNYWHQEWLAGKEKKSGYDPIFVPWYDVEIYTKPIEDYEHFIKKMEHLGTEEDNSAWFLWESGATLEGINWYYDFMRTEGYSSWRMKSEFPTNDIEMFQSTGHRVFHQQYVINARRNIQDPKYTGEIVADERFGANALKNIKFESGTNGCLRLWAKPDKSIKVSNRYVLFADIGGRGESSDWSAIKVLDRYPMIDGGVPEVVAVWRGHIDQDLFAWKCAQLGRWYNNALVAVESNKLKHDIKSTEGDYFLTVLDEIAPHYDNLYARTDIDKVIQGAPVRYGFHTTQGNKEKIISSLRKAIREELYLERDVISCNEMDTYEYKNDGSMGSVDKTHDDMVIVTAGAVWLALSHMKLPSEIRKKGAKTIYTAHSSEAVL